MSEGYYSLNIDCWFPLPRSDADDDEDTVVKQVGVVRTVRTVTTTEVMTMMILVVVEHLSAASTTTTECYTTRKIRNCSYSTNQRMVLPSTFSEITALHRWNIFQ